MKTKNPWTKLKTQAGNIGVVRRCLVLAGVATALLLPQARAQPTNPAEFRAQFVELCDLAANKLLEANGITEANGRPHYFVDSYAIRALCVAYDLTGKPEYLNTCRAWSERVLNYQQQMTPAGAYYMHYGRKPGETNGDWYVADSSSIAMAVLATAVRCQGAEQKRRVHSAEQFADLVTKNYVKPSGGVTDGIWSKSKDEWWCSSGLFGSMLFNLYAQTGNKHYLKTALGVVDWLNGLDLTKDQPLPLAMQGPTMPMYVMECYSAGWPYLAAGGVARKNAALKKISWCLDWTAEQQRTLPLERQWPATNGWGMKFGGLPFHQYIFARQLSADGKLSVEADDELQRLAGIVFGTKPELTQLSVFMVMSYAERLDPGAIYRHK